MVKVRKAKAIERLQKLAEDAFELMNEDYESQELQKLTQDTENTFIRLFGENSRQHRRIPAGYTVSSTGIQSYVRQIAALVESCLDDVKYFWEDEESLEERPVEEKTADGNTRGIHTSEHAHRNENPNKVFVIHGHDEAARERLARFLQKLGLEPVILHEQPNEGRTIIEKLEDYTDVRFAIVLLTPDDLGAPKDKKNSLKPRARQNVVFELGYFIGKLARNRVCALVKGDVEKPSDYDGVVYIAFDDTGGWEMRLIRELKNAGFDIDANQVV